MAMYAPWNEFNRSRACTCGSGVFVYDTGTLITPSYGSFYICVVRGSSAINIKWLMRRFHKPVIKLAGTIHDNCTVQHGHVWHVVDGHNALDMAMIWIFFFKQHFKVNLRHAIRRWQLTPNTGSMSFNEIHVAWLIDMLSVAEHPPHGAKDMTEQSINSWFRKINIAVFLFLKSCLLCHGAGVCHSSAPHCKGVFLGKLQFQNLNQEDFGGRRFPYQTTTLSSDYPLGSLTV